MIIFSISFIIWFTVKSLSHNSLRMQILHIVALPKLQNSKLTISNCNLPKDNNGWDHFSQNNISKHVFSYNSKVFYFLKVKLFPKSSKQIYQNLSQNKSHVSFANTYISNANLSKPSKHKDKVYSYIVKPFVSFTNSCLYENCFNSYIYIYRYFENPFRNSIFTLINKVHKYQYFSF